MNSIVNNVSRLVSLQCGSALQVFISGETARRKNCDRPLFQRVYRYVERKSAPLKSPKRENRQKQYRRREIPRCTSLLRCFTAAPILLCPWHPRWRLLSVFC